MSIHAYLNCRGNWCVSVCVCSLKLFGSREENLLECFERLGWTAISPIREYEMDVALATAANVAVQLRLNPVPRLASKHWLHQ